MEHIHLMILKIIFSLPAFFRLTNEQFLSLRESVTLEGADPTDIFFYNFHTFNKTIFTSKWHKK